jgi:GNAT superfamily N-acetyltransferase
MRSAPHHAQGVAGVLKKRIEGIPCHDANIDANISVQVPVQIRVLNTADPPILSAAFAGIGWGKPVAQYQRYLAEEAVGTRTYLVATVDGQFAGYVTVNWAPTTPGFVDPQIPETQDLNVLPAFRRRGIASRLLDRAEAEVARRSAVAGIGLGLHPGYNAAQKLYGHPNGLGIAYWDRYAQEGEQVVLDDDLVLHLTKRLRPYRNPGQGSAPVVGAEHTRLIKYSSLA